MLIRKTKQSRTGDRPKSHSEKKITEEKSQDRKSQGKSHRRKVTGPKVTGKKSKQAVWEGVGIGGGGVTVQRVKERGRNTNFVILHERRRVGRVQNSRRACPCNCVR